MVNENQKGTSVHFDFHVISVTVLSRLNLFTFTDFDVAKVSVYPDRKMTDEAIILFRCYRFTSQVAIYEKIETCELSTTNCKMLQKRTDGTGNVSTYHLSEDISDHRYTHS